jgi:hypothetical protein
MRDYDVIILRQDTPELKPVLASASAVLPRRTEQCVDGECYAEFRR